MVDHFENVAAQWDSPEKVQMTSRFFDEMLLHLMIQPGWKAMEIGAGTGLVGLRLLPLVDRLIFEDTSPAMLAVLQQKLHGDSNAEVLCGEVTEYCAQDIDLVFSCMAFHHIPKVDELIRHLATIVRSGGRVVIADLIQEDGSFHHHDPIPHKGFDTESLAVLFRTAGFSVDLVRIYSSIFKTDTEGTKREYPQFVLVATRQ